MRLPQGEGAKDRIVPCIVNYMMGSRLQVITYESLRVGTLLSVEHEDCLLMGEVTGCVSQAHLWQVEVALKHVLNGLMNVMALRAGLLQESEAPVAVPVPPVRS
jgi:hypothetical protein